MGLFSRKKSISKVLPDEAGSGSRNALVRTLSPAGLRRSRSATPNHEQDRTDQVKDGGADRYARDKAGDRDRDEDRKRDQDGGDRARGQNRTSSLRVSPSNGTATDKEYNMLGGPSTETKKPISSTNTRANPSTEPGSESHPKSDSVTDSYSDTDSDTDSDSDTDTDTDSEEVTHDHAMQPQTSHASQFPTFMGFRGLSRSARDEPDASRPSVSLLHSSAHIPRLSPSMDRSDPRAAEPAIGDEQTKLITTLRKRLAQLMDSAHDAKAQRAALVGHATLEERYGVLTKVVGRGAYGIIRVAAKVDKDGKQHSAEYAIKELQRRDKSTESRERFIDRVVSEFVLSSTLNCKNLVRTFDLLVMLAPESASANADLKVGQVMEYTGGGDLFSYCRKCVATQEYLSIEQIDCMAKQLASGLWYMHQHGVAHCDVKLENVLLAYGAPTAQSRAPLTLKLSDFGKSSVFRTKWDRKEQLWPTSSGLLGTEPYMAPEEHEPASFVSLPKKDCWALGIAILALFNFRRSYFSGRYGDFCSVSVHDKTHDEDVSLVYPATVLWTSTAQKNKKAKDEVFGEYCNSRMLADYNRKTKEWTIRRRGSFAPIETLFEETDKEDFDEDDFVLRRFFLYKLLDTDPARRASVDELLRGDWMRSVRCCE
ncbi:putative serine/threonine-protein kinase [Clavispora lusitaniae]|uniref:Serine/threonine-protein kinase n=1 Tax=Clavispora lusitaniae TaxID=36911 RepID=A0AA91PWP0_CLALS|nr:putative serine/threonine-protein kinase [Clavispora lusitaniae]